MRSDPLGAEIFYESLENMPGISASQNLDPLENLTEVRDTTLFSLGEDANHLDMIPENELKKAENMAAGGGRLVVTFFPQNRANVLSSHVTPFAPPGSDEKTKKEKKDEELRKQYDATGIKIVSLKDAWGVTPTHKFQTASDIIVANNQNGNDTVRWHSSLWFDELDPRWHAVYSVGPRPVIIEKRTGAGSIVLCSDSYFLSNEAMVKDRAPKVLSWLVGPSKQVIFDETHFGVTRSANIATLARKYRLHGVVAAILLLVGLLIWKNSTSLVPAVDNEHGDSAGTQMIERNMTAGLENLLRRNVPSAEVLEVCFSEWKKSKGRSEPAARIAAMQAVIDEEKSKPALKRSPASSYLALCRILAERKKNGR